jgi:hypothetical protein
MTAHFYCWEPSLQINPTSPNFRQQLREAQANRAAVPPSSKLLAFVADLLSKFPDLTVTDDAPWATGPLAGEITGKFINFPVSWSWYHRSLVAFIVETANSHGLHCYDPQGGKLYACAAPSTPEEGRKGKLALQPSSENCNNWAGAMRLTSGSELSKLKAAMFASLREVLSGEGFKLKAEKDCFVRAHKGHADIFRLVCLSGLPGWRVQPNVAIRIERVENIFHRTSGFEAMYQTDTPTIGGAVGNIKGGDNLTCEFVLENPAEVPKLTGAIMAIFHQFAIPYFDKFSTLAAIDAELNSRPRERTPNRALPWLRCSTGIIVARLIGRPDYDTLAKTYSEILTRTNKGFYLKRFEALLESLKDVAPEHDD